MLAAVSCGEESKPRLTGGELVDAPRQEVPRLAVSRGVGGNPPLYDIAVSDADGEGLQVLTGDSKKDPVRPTLFGRVAWSPDARRIAFTAILDRRGFATDIYVMDADGSGVRRLTRARDAGMPVWSPDGRTIVFARRGEMRAFPPRSSLWSISADGSHQRPLTGRREDTAEQPGSFSPDGTQLVFARGKRLPLGDQALVRERNGVFLLDLESGAERQLTDHGESPAFSPDGRRIAFASARDRNGTLSYGDFTHQARELYVMCADGSDQRRLTRTRVLNERSPSWLPDGTRIAYQRGRVIGNAEGTIVMQVNPDGSCPTPLLADPRLDVWYSSPVWRPGRARRGNGALTCSPKRETKATRPQTQARPRPPKSDAEAIRDVHRRYFKEVGSGHREAACQLLTPAYRARLVEARRRERPDVRIPDCASALRLPANELVRRYEPRLENVRIRGESARAFDPGRPPFQPQTVTFRRVGRSWKVAGVKTHTRPAP